MKVLTSAALGLEFDPKRLCLRQSSVHLVLNVEAAAFTHITSKFTQDQW